MVLQNQSQDHEKYRKPNLIEAVDLERTSIAFSDCILSGCRTFSLNGRKFENGPIQSSSKCCPDKGLHFVFGEARGGKYPGRILLISRKLKGRIRPWEHRAASHQALSPPLSSMSPESPGSGEDTAICGTWKASVRCGLASRHVPLPRRKSRATG